MPNRDGTGSFGSGGCCGGREQMQGAGFPHGEYRSKGSCMPKFQKGKCVGRGAEKCQGKK